MTDKQAFKWIEESVAHCAFYGFQEHNDELFFTHRPDESQRYFKFKWIEDKWVLKEMKKQGWESIYTTRFYHELACYLEIEIDIKGV